MSAWWREFFDGDYLFLYGAALTPERTEHEVAGIVSTLRLAPGARVLDLCCGDGRHAVPLQRRGFRVTGLDASGPLLAAAQRRAEAVGAHPALVQADARVAPLRARGSDDPLRARGSDDPLRARGSDDPLRARGFDAALLLFNSIGYGTDDDTLAMLRTARAAAPQLLLECAHRDEQVRRAQPGVARDWLELQPGPARPGSAQSTARVLTERWIDPVEGVAHAVFRFGEPERVKRFRHRLYSATEVAGLLRAAGFARVDCYGGYDRRPFSIDAPLLVAHARAA